MTAKEPHRQSSLGVDTRPGPVVIDGTRSAPNTAADLSRGDAALLERNLTALARGSAEAVARIRASAEHSDVSFTMTDEGVPTCSISDGGASRQLASRRRPLDEARRLTDPLDPADTGVFVVAGFGLGYHVAELCRKVGRSGVIVVFEPDVALLRSVLARVDFGVVVSNSNLCILTDPGNASPMMHALRGVEGLVGLGVKLLEHPPSVPRLGAQTAAFHERFISVVEAVKMTVVTSLVQTQVTFRNLLQNVDAYAKWPGIAEIQNLMAGRPAVVVSAGPSLARNVALLKDPSVRERCAIIAVQTVLRPLLAQGIRPHFVTALDYSEISRRFYEGLTEADVRGITLVAEAKVNPGVLQAWPGAVRIIGDGILDELLGPSFARPRGRLRAGATVAHLAYYLARHLGCDPVGLIGQDLGFTDGQYYAAGAAIHDVWAAEINEFNTLEMLEHQRIMRMGRHLRKAEDVLGRPIHTDEQMLAYLRQFEEDFRLDEAKGLLTIDCTEGGVRKEHTTVGTLREFLVRAADPGATPISAPCPDPAPDAPAALKRLPDRLIELQRQVSEIAASSAKAATLLSELLEHARDRARADRVLSQIDRLSSRVHELQPAFSLVQHLGQAMVFNRLKADRLIGLAADLDEEERQKRRIERDIANVNATRATALTLGRLLTDALQALRTGRKQSRDLSHDELLGEIRATPRDETRERTEARRARVVAFIPVDPHRSALDLPRRLDRPIAGAPNLLCATLRRLARCSQLDGFVLATDNAEHCRALVDADPALAALDLRIVSLPPGRVLPRRRAVAAARRWCATSWRGGIGNLSVYDELFEPLMLSGVLADVGADAALLVGPDWCFVDPALCDRVIDRHREQPLSHRMTFSQAAPGLAGCVVSAAIVQDMAASAGRSRTAASVGGVMAYHPTQPMADLLAHRVNVTVDPLVRDEPVRWIIDDAPALERFASLAAELPTDADAPALIAARRRAGGPAFARLSELVIDVRLSPASDPGALTTPEALQPLLRQVWEHNPSAALTLRLGRTTPAAVGALVSCARLSGLTGVHMHVPAAAIDASTPEEWLRLECDVLSVSVDAADAPLMEPVLALSRARAARHPNDDFQSPWIVPRLMRSDRSYPHVERFVTESIGAAAWCTLDPIDAFAPRESSAPGRIAALPLPAQVRERWNRSRLIVLADGRALIDPSGRSLAQTVPALNAPFADVWTAVLAARGVDTASPGARA